MREILAPAKALADESRLKILWMLEGRRRCVCEIQAVLGLAQSTVSRHMQVLEDAGFVVAERNGPWKDYRLNPAPPPFVQGLLAQVRMAGETHPVAREVREQAAGVSRENLCAA
ncbi:ArsR/SmtB family transcription factor [Deferrisoma camini]|uniref:ArsR/SmtB family transcription factor n=1 Tax=Deferrisoma camini TaxID=1035120 RepID=UPI00046D6031|nr:metalloregulator ArsR/SmtB family transcription factor [Deferrisoma camini]